MGWREYEPIAARYRAPIVIAGIGRVALVEGVLLTVRPLEQGRFDGENQYARAVAIEGNVAARRTISQVFDIATEAGASSGSFRSISCGRASGPGPRETKGMDTQAVLRDLSERLAASASVRAVFGEPVIAGERKVVPVAKVCYTFGAGGGRRRQDDQGPGGGGGGSVAAWPAGALEVTPSGTRFLGYHSGLRLGIAMGAGFVLGTAVAIGACWGRLQRG